MWSKIFGESCCIVKRDFLMHGSTTLDGLVVTLVSGGALANHAQRLVLILEVCRYMS